MVVETKDFTDGDMWTLRAALLVFGLYCVSFTVRPLIQKVFVNKSIGLSYVLKKQTRFFNLINAGAGVALTFPFYDLIPHLKYYTILSFFAGLFVLTETYISFKRIPFQLIPPKTRLYLKLVIKVQSFITVLRIVGDIFFFIYCFTGPYKEELYIFIRVLRMLCAAAFAVTELGVSKVTLDLISAPQDNMCIEMKVQLKDTKSKLHALAQANMTGGVAAIVDLVNSWVELQMTQALVIAIASTTFIFYGRLFQIGLEEKEKRGSAETNSDRSSNHKTPNHSGSSMPHKSVSASESPKSSFDAENTV